MGWKGGLLWGQLFSKRCFLGEGAEGFQSLSPRVIDALTTHSGELFWSLLIQHLLHNPRFLFVSTHSFGKRVGCLADLRYSSVLLSAGDTFQDPHWMLETVASTEPYIYYVSSSPSMPTIKFNL